MSTQIERDRIMNEFTQATIEAEHDEMSAAIDLGAETVTDACHHTSAIIYTASDQGDWLAVAEIECAVHEPGKCPADNLEDDLYASHIYTAHLDWLSQEVPLRNRAISRHESRWHLDLITYRARVDH